MRSSRSRVRLPEIAYRVRLEVALFSEEALDSAVEGGKGRR